MGALLDPAFSPHYDLCKEDFFLWLLHLLEAGKLDSRLISLPGSTFSSAARPLFRTFREPFGDCSSPKVARENLVMQRALLLLTVARRLGIPCLLHRSRKGKNAEQGSRGGMSAGWRKQLKTPKKQNFRKAQMMSQNPKTWKPRNPRKYRVEKP